MLTLRHHIALYTGAMLASVACGIWIFAVPLWWYAALTTVFAGVLAYGSAHIGSQIYMPVLTSGRITENAVAITFDDGPVQETTASLLALLKEFDVQAAFFMVGRKAESNGAIVRRIDAEDHLLGNHTYSHLPYFNLLPVSRTVKEIAACEEVVFSLTGRRMRCFRPPFGVTNPTLRRAVDALDYTAVGWNIRSFDTVRRSEHAIMRRIATRIRPGAVVLLHETTPNITEILRTLLVHLRERRYTVVRIDHLLGIGAYR